MTMLPSVEHTFTIAVVGALAYVGGVEFLRLLVWASTWLRGAA